MIDFKEVLRVAALAKIEISEDEAKKLQIKFSKILESFDSLNAIETDKVEPLYCFATETQQRLNDEALNLVEREDVLKNCPDRYENYFRISKVVKSGETK